MLRKLYLFGLISWVAVSAGCAVCCSPDDWNYGAYGGRWQRHDLSSGRVGSAFAEAGYDTMANIVEADATPAGEPRQLPGDDHIRPVSYETENVDSLDYTGVGAYIE